MTHGSSIARCLRALGALLIAKVAAAESPRHFRDAVDDFSLTFSPEGAALCEVSTVARNPEASCDDELGSDDSRRLLRPGAEAVIVSRNGARYLLVHSVQSVVAGEAWVRAVTSEAQARHPGASVSQKYSDPVSRTRIGMAEVMRVDLVISGAGGPDEPLESVSWLIPGRSAFHTFAVEAPTRTASLARADLQAALPTLIVTISPFAVLWVGFVRYWYILVLLLLPVGGFTMYVLVRNSKRASRHGGVALR